MGDYLKEYIESLTKAITSEKLPDSKGVVLNFPFLDPSNDYISILFEKEGDNIRISDCGETEGYIYLSGSEGFMTQSQPYINIFKEFEVSTKGSELYKIVPPDELSFEVNRLISCIMVCMYYYRACIPFTRP